MSQLFARLQRLFDEGHGIELPDLLNDQRFADPDPRPAAVLIPVVERPDSEGGPTAILTKRLDDMRKHPGQVAFPGGRIDPGEDAVEAALREAHEELALEPAHVRVVGATDRYVTGTGFEITPVLGVVPPGLPLEPNPGEVEAWFETPLSVLLDRANWSRNTVFWKGADRTYYEMEWDGFHIWGVTAAIIVNLSRRLAWVES